MARKGENIRKRKGDGRWEARCWYYNRESGCWKYKYLYASTYEDAKQKKETFARKLQTNENNPQKKRRIPHTEEIFFTDMAEEWLDTVKKQNKRSTYVKYRTAYSRHIEETMKNVTLGSITNAFVDEKLLAALSSDSLRKSISCIVSRVMVFSAEKYGFSLPKLNRPTVKSYTGKAEPLSREEQAKLITVLYDNMDTYKMAVLFNLYTGMRIGETSALKWSDIDFAEGIISVERTVQRLSVEGTNTKTTLVITEPKTAHSTRKIPVPRKILEMMVKFRKDGEYVFCGKKPMEPRNMENHFARILEEAGIKHHKYHSLRHTFATNSIAMGTDIKSLSEILGHSNVSTTMNLYVHPSMETKRKYMEEMDGFYSRLAD